MLMEMAEAQAEKMQQEAMNHLGSDEFSKMLATKINEKVNKNKVRKIRNSLSRIFFFS